VVGLGEGDLEGPLAGAADDVEFEGAAACRREGVEQVIGCAGWLARGRHDQVARGEAGAGGGLASATSRMSRPSVSGRPTARRSRLAT